MNLFINRPICPWGLLQFMHPCCPRQTSLLQCLSLTVSLLLSLVEIRAILMEAGVLNSSITEGIAILVPSLTFTASTALPATTTDRATGREIGSAIGDPIPVASCVKLSDILLLSAPNFSNVVMVNSIVPIWHYTILQVLLNGFRTPVQIYMSHLTLQP